MSDYIAELQAAFLRLHGCDATYVETVPVIEEFEGKRFGKVTLKYLTYAGIPKRHAVTDGATLQARRIKQTLFYRVAVDSPQAAVKVGIMSVIKYAQKRSKGR